MRNSQRGRKALDEVTSDPFQVPDKADSEMTEHGGVERIRGVLWYERRGHIVVLTLDDPDTRNALGEATFGAFEDVVNRINGDLSVRCAVLTGAGPAFCSGDNRSDMRAPRGMFGGTAHDIEAQYRAGIQRIPRALFRLDIPLLAAVKAVTAAGEYPCGRVLSERSGTRAAHGRVDRHVRCRDVAVTRHCETASFDTKVTRPPPERTELRSVAGKRSRAVWRVLRCVRLWSF